MVRIFIILRWKLKINREMDLKANTERYSSELRLDSVNNSEGGSALSLGRPDRWQHYDNLSHIWWMFGISDWGEGISLSGWGSLDRMMRKISQHLHWGNILQISAWWEARSGRERGNHHLCVTASFLLAREYAGNADSDDSDVILDRNRRGFDISNSS